ncbi:lysis system i-spanin subunit Rz [Oceanisphaera sp. KMM 10153]|uniref:lysis system i-spanin subunit Rz n=1 Tax=Oceanisphaera submarina TaxID=3390193 RepID=UPI003975373C
MMTRLFSYGLAIFAAAYLAWFTTATYYHAELTAVQRDHAEQLRMMVEINAAELEQATRKAESLQQQVAAIDAHYTQELNDAKANVDRLRDAVDSGARRLHILAKRPIHCPAVPGAPGDTGMGDGEAVELAPGARRAYYRLRYGITADIAKLAACQEILKAMSEGTNAAENSQGLSQARLP